MKHEFDLQLFAEGGDGAAPAAGGNTPSAAQPTDARLRELGVPEERLQKRAKREEKRRKGDLSGVNPPISAQRETHLPQAQQQKARQTNNRSRDFRAHFEGMTRQAAEMAERYPDFDLGKELDNPTFLRLTGPEIGLPLEDAYMALHHRELTRAIAERSRRELSNSIRAGAARPVENGIGAKAPSVVTFDYKNATKSQRTAFKKQIYDAAARGEKIYPAR